MDMQVTDTPMIVLPLATGNPSSHNEPLYLSKYVFCKTNMCIYPSDFLLMCDSLLHSQVSSRKPVVLLTPLSPNLKQQFRQFILTPIHFIMNKH